MCSTPKYRPKARFISFPGYNSGQYVTDAHAYSYIEIIHDQNVINSEMVAYFTYLTLPGSAT